jgi:hypothetical protein
MRKLDQYRRGLELCRSNAAKAPSEELRALWQNLAATYAFLAELEEFGPRVGAPDRAQQFQDHFPDPSQDQGGPGAAR